MVKLRPVVVISPKISVRAGLCTVVALSTTPPRPVMPYHRMLEIDPPLPPPWSGEPTWIKGDMVYAVAFHRLDFIRHGKGADGRRRYRYETLGEDQMRDVRHCVLCGLGPRQRVQVNRAVV